MLTEDGVSSWGGIEAHWSPWYMSRPEIKASVTSPSGQTTTLDLETISDAPVYPEAPDIYSDARVLRGPLPAVAVGALVDQTVVTRTTKPFVGGAYAHYVLVAGGVPRKKVEIVVDMPAAAPFTYELRDAKVEVGDSRAKGRRRVTFEGGPYEALEPLEPLTPSDVAPWPYLAFSTGKSWQR